MHLYDTATSYTFAVGAHFVKEKVDQCWSFCGYELSGKVVPVTHRLWHEYPVSFRRAFPSSIPNDAQFIEVGAGLGDVVPTIVKQGAIKRPIVIDPFRYDYLDILLDRAKQEVETSELLAVIQGVQEKTCLMQDKTQVEWIPMTLDEAVRLKPHIHNSGDIIVDSFGAKYYSGSRAHTQLVSPTGAIYTDGVEDH